ncbi:twin-arginine translocation pathway signal protein [Motilimonas cestriensis]|uniref:Twin-arginine translocation pathway signal protein n=1 Tax=Motilimonas cestriensis TaxID=2742685 RepID=A0ABS8WBX9_9GAMM|nr:twin-arginine translocation pathway signal protein [Motilimonas cestriensis]MCE2595802.1 twin-arginine translocation pathway signal protein [Motilimonas cestriensis]
MDRRGFIKMIGVGAAATTFSSALLGCSDGSAAVDFGWNGPAADEKDIRLKVLAYAILCPNPHNKQPWLIKLNSPNSFDLFVDQERLLPETDPYARQIHIGQGTFLETLSIAATAYGYQADIDYFPDGEYSNLVIEDLPVARITLLEQNDMATDPLFSHLLTRQSNKREYDNSLLTPKQKAQLTLWANSSSGQLTLVDGKEQQAYMQQMLTEAMQIEVGNQARDMETIKMFRFNDAEVAKYRDGFGLAHSGVTGIKKFVAETFILDRASTEKDPSDFGKQSVEVARSASQSTSTFAWLSTKTNSRLDQVKIGRDYCRLNLTTTAMGLAQHPMSQVLQEYPDMLPLQQAFKQQFNIAETDTVQMLVRLGKAAATAHTPRRLVRDLIITN